MSESAAELSSEGENTLPILELDANSIIPPESVPKTRSFTDHRPWWILTFELVLAAAILLFFI